MVVQLRSALMMFFILTILTGVAYPLAVTAIAQLLFPHQANGSLISKDGKPIPSISGDALPRPLPSPTMRRPHPVRIWALPIPR